MATEVATRRGPITAAEIVEAKGECERGLVTPSLTTAQATALQSTVTRLSVPATDEWVRGRIFTLLSHYFQRDDAEELERAIAADWVEALMMGPKLPAWAINAACVAWLGSKDARRRPLPGDIRQLAFEQMPWLISAQLRLKIHEDPERWAFTEMGKRLALMAPEPEPTEEQRQRVTKLLSDLALSLQAKALES